PAPFDLSVRFRTALVPTPLCSMAWLAIGGLMSEVIKWLSGEIIEFNLTCRLSDDEMMFRLYNRDALVQRLAPSMPRHFRECSMKPVS
ncbi:MAG TPA: hypothetical protein PK706_20840, partial [Xanthobacteraceae bacterium]|nr:hypothetical protein [Xanthobacteraceae bacterium]